jgi:hypothetical protein
VRRYRGSSSEELTGKSEQGVVTVRVFWSVGLVVFSGTATGLTVISRSVFFFDEIVVVTLRARFVWICVLVIRWQRFCFVTVSIITSRFVVFAKPIVLVFVRLIFVVNLLLVSVFLVLAFLIMTGSRLEVTVRSMTHKHFHPPHGLVGIITIMLFAVWFHVLVFFGIITCSKHAINNSERYYNALNAKRDEWGS